MTLHPGSSIGQYRVLQEFTGGANCNWTFAERDGAEYFVKEFHRPKYPPDTITGALRTEKLKRCETFETRHKRLVAAMGRVCAPGGNIVMPVNFFRLGLMYYHIAPRIDTTSLAPGEIAVLPLQERMILLRLLSRSLRTLHSQHIVHGDLKPSNILIHRSGGGLLAPKLIDFDGSFFHGEPPDQVDMAFDQNYMAPEVLAYNKESGSSVKPNRLGTAADVFSFGILLHEYWTGRRPALGDGHIYISEALRAGSSVQLDLSGMNRPLERLTRQGLSLDVLARPPIEQFDQAIGEALAVLRGVTLAKTMPSGSDEGSAVKVRLPLSRSGSIPSAGKPVLCSREVTPTPSSIESVGMPRVLIRTSRNLKGKDH